MDKKKRAQEKRADVYYQFYNMMPVESADGLTGLVPATPETGFNYAAYSALEGMPFPTDDEEEKS